MYTDRKSAAANDRSDEDTIILRDFRLPSPSHSAFLGRRIYMGDRELAAVAGYIHGPSRKGSK